MAAGLAQVLSYHSVSSFKFELSGLRTGSIRDQMLRARLLTDALLECGHIGSDRPLLVVGGGVAGVVCALNASRHGTDVTLLELADGPFRTQMSATSRYLDPAEFDWPHPLWDSEQPPWQTSDLPLVYWPGHADMLALDWEDIFLDWVMGVHLNRPPYAGQIDFYQGVDARQFSYVDYQDSTGQGVRVLGKNIQGPFEFGAAISCIGFSGERVSLDASTYSGFEFWGPDPIDQPNCGIRSQEIKVLISGGGDGAQQDFLRVLTGAFGARLYKKLAPEFPPDLRLLDAVMIEDEARRAFVWRRDRQLLPVMLLRWNQEFVKVIDSIWNGWDPAKRLALAKQLLRPGVEVTWIIGGSVPDFSYALNRFLVQLIARLYSFANGRLYETPLVSGNFSAPQDEVILRGCWLHNIYVPPAVNQARSTSAVAAVHSCGRPTECIGVPHRVQLRTSRDFTPGDPITDLGDFSLILIRHGVDQQPLFRPAPISEQIVPRGIPG